MSKEPKTFQCFACFETTTCPKRVTLDGQKLILCPECREMYRDWKGR